MILHSCASPNLSREVYSIVWGFWFITSPRILSKCWGYSFIIFWKSFRIELFMGSLNWADAKKEWNKKDITVSFRYFISKKFCSKYIFSTKNYKLSTLFTNLITLIKKTIIWKTGTSLIPVNKLRFIKHIINHHLICCVLSNLFWEYWFPDQVRWHITTYL